MIEAKLLFTEVGKNGEVVVEKAIEIEGRRSEVKCEMAALLESLWDVDDGKTFCDAIDIHQKKLLSQKA